MYPTPPPSHIVYRIADSFARHRWLFLVSLCAVTGVVSAALLLRAKTYAASATTRIVIDDGMAERLGIASVQNVWISPAQQNTNLFNDLLKDDLPGGFLDSALQAAKLSRPIRVDPLAQDARYALLRKRLNTWTDSNNLFSVGLTWDDPAECERIVKALRDRYVEEVSASQQVKAVATTTFLESEIANYERRMRVAEQALVAYKQNNAGRLPEAQTADIAQLADLKKRQADLRITARDSALKRAALQKRLAQIKPVSILAQTTRAVADNPAARALQVLETQRTIELATKGESYSDIVDLNEKISRLKQQLGRQATAVPGKGGVPRTVTETDLQENPEYQALSLQLTEANIGQNTQLAQVRLVRQQIAEVEARVRHAPLAQRALTDKTRDYEVLKAQYENLLERREQAQIKANLDKVTAASTLSQIGTVHAEPTVGRLKVLVMLAASAFLGLVVATGLVVAGEWADPSLRYEEDVPRLLNLPVLVSVPDNHALRALASPAQDEHDGSGEGVAPKLTNSMPPSVTAPTTSVHASTANDDANVLSDVTLRLPRFHGSSSE